MKNEILVPYMFWDKRTQYVITGKIWDFANLRLSWFGVRVNFGLTRTEVLRPSHADETYIVKNKYKSVNGSEMWNIWPEFTSYCDPNDIHKYGFELLEK